MFRADSIKLLTHLNKFTNFSLNVKSVLFKNIFGQRGRAQWKKLGNFMHLQFRGYFLKKYYLIKLKRHLQILR